MNAYVKRMTSIAKATIYSTSSPIEGGVGSSSLSRTDGGMNLSNVPMLINAAKLRGACLQASLRRRKLLFSFAKLALQPFHFTPRLLNFKHGFSRDVTPVASLGVGHMLKLAEPFLFAIKVLSGALRPIGARLNPVLAFLRLVYARICRHCGKECGNKRTNDNMRDVFLHDEAPFVLPLTFIEGL